MRCANCSHDNNANAKFCEHCGKPLERVCPQCGRSVSPTARFCANCGHNLEAATATSAATVVSPRADSPQALVEKFMPKEVAAKLEAARASKSVEGERRIVTILFCDVKGSTAMAEQMDPEEWAELMNTAFEYLIAPVYKYEGTVARLMGDAILAFFGAPIAHEDDPQRAVLAGLAILDGIGTYRARVRRERGLDFSVRVGLNTGLVVVANIGSDLKYEYTAMGDAINLAARMQSAAEPNTVLIASNTARLVRHAFELESRGNLELKGKAEPVAAYRVVAPKTVVESARGIEGLDSPLVGREREVQLLQARIHELMDGRGQIISVMGEAGLGKSRLVAEVIQHSQREFTRLEGRCLSYTTSTPFVPFVDLLNRLFDLRAEESDEQKYAKVKDPFLATLLGIKFGGADLERVMYLEPPHLRAHIFAAVSETIERTAKQTPLVLVFEDLHWADSTSLELLEQLMAVTERAPLMLVGVFRPQRQEPSWRFHETAARDYAHRYTPLTLEPLDESHARALVANLLQIEDLPEKVRALILKKAEGNPFYVEEVIRSLLDAKLVVRENSHWRATREIANIALPDTLTGVIGARLDRLDDESKRAAQTASVIGREFALDVLVDVHDAPRGLDESLTTLQRREIVHEKSRMPQRAFSFKHVLTQEAAYNSLLMSKRRELHRRVAECLEKMDATRANEIAWHFLDAQEPARALPYLATAAERAAHAYATPEAIKQFERAQELVQDVTDPALVRRIYEGLGGALTLTNEPMRALAVYIAMEQYGIAHGNVPMRVSALNKMSFVQAMWLGQLDQAETCLNSSEQLARAHDDRPGLAEQFMMRCNVGTIKGELEELVRHLDNLVATGRALNRPFEIGFGLTHTANAYTYLTRFDEAWEAAQASRQFAEQNGDLYHLAKTTAFSIVFGHLRNGDLDAARAAAEEGVQIAARIGSAGDEAVGCIGLGSIARLRGEYEQALAWHQRAVKAGESSGFPFITVSALGGLCGTHIEISPRNFERTRALHEQAMHLLEHPMGALGGAFAWADLGECALAIGMPDRARDCFQKGLTGRSPFMYLQRPRLLADMALATAALGDLAGAATRVDEARAYAEERAMKNVYPFIAFADGQVSAARGDHERALAQFTRAEELAATMTMRPLVWHARAASAQTLAALGRADEAQVKRTAALAMRDEIAGLFQDAELRAVFLN